LFDVRKVVNGFGVILAKATPYAQRIDLHGEFGSATARAEFFSYHCGLGYSFDGRSIGSFKGTFDVIGEFNHEYK